LIDIISMYSFGHTIGALERDDLGHKWSELMSFGVKFNPFARTFPFLARRMLHIPKWITNHFPMFEGTTEFLDIANNLTRIAMDQALEDRAKGKVTDDAQHRTVLHSMIHSETLPEEEKTLERLSANGLTLIAGGYDTTSRTLSVITYHVLSKPHIHSRLLAELRTFIPTPQSDLPSVATLEKLPYLTSIIHEGLRVAHPVAGRLPGHMNVLLAEANAPYPQLKDLDEINPAFARTDVVLVIGANDVTNPAARRPGNPVSGMPILDVDHAKSVIVIKRSLGHGYAGIDNELYSDPKTAMLFADAKAGLAALLAGLHAYA